MHLCLLTADYTVKPVLSGHSKKNTNYRLMKVKSIAAILSTSIKLPFVIKIFVLSFFEWLYCIDNLHVLSVLLSL